MTEYLLVWECYNVDWTLLEKGNFILRVPPDESFEDSLFGYCEGMAEAREIPPNRMVVSNCVKIN